ncbi:hypothetical protein J1N09_07575 [Aureitalea sp. L0-47]|uniref:hypothetical protein n=1 Tax=Aureitalea sp. L0-47 TaxID=2816962 RepID=UPI002238525C|nr:hypothetical protein [Aureitalea sp. L0-47]MCW5519693.1 hypothetical protein [Aureitalea sp. L0-47]
MESTRIERLLDAYFEGNTTLAEEAALRDYFTSDEVADHLAPYAAMFKGFVQAQQEVSTSEVTLPQSGVKMKRWWYSIAATFLVALTVGSFVFSNQGLSSEEEEALAALQQTREAMMMLSSNLNKGTENVAFLNEFAKGSSNIKHINQFTETKNRILK